MTIDLIWNKFPLKQVELKLSKVLRCGQTFRWKNVNNVWSYTTKNKIILLKQDEEYIHYSWIASEDIRTQLKLNCHFDKETFEFIKDYFNLPIKLETLYEEWIEKDGLFKISSKKSAFDQFTGIRILRQDPWETLISFICSSNNNVKRISKMCDSICTEFGKYINEYNGIKYYSFPTAEDLSSNPKVESRLRDLGFGYRAKYIYQTALKFTSDEFPDITLDNLYQLRTKDYETAHQFLLQLTGVGPKVADCICLMALDKHDIVPVDTHVYQIAIRDYKFKGKKDLKTMNKKTYHDIRLFFKEIFGDFAGWAQSVLFTSDLSDLNNGVNKSEETEIKIEQKSEEPEIKIEQKPDSIVIQRKRGIILESPLHQENSEIVESTKKRSTK
ncbi:uncharacterized protein AC631_02009 [Debaryomyces fabryi]|uniref:N-glycosylase/DNA lyase n=1 Tax=Debaryomyces fabryi TaxID=58627 RepID=A0A0V1Q1W2_9ASCO|nr:uncharacterized protein AC631_02009 [Debaryomyces fabryi]KSA02191.1 hypothetical protein AC631_02009 [Debaryomyces fabryi]